MTCSKSRSSREPSCSRLDFSLDGFTHGGGLQSLEAFDDIGGCMAIPRGCIGERTREARLLPALERQVIPDLVVWFGRDPHDEKAAVHGRAAFVMPPAPPHLAAATAPLQLPA